MLNITEQCSELVNQQQGKANHAQLQLLKSLVCGITNALRLRRSNF